MAEQVQDHRLLGQKVLVTAFGMAFGYGLMAMSQVPGYGPDFAYALGGLGVLLVLALTTVRGTLDFIMDMVAESFDSFFLVPVIWTIGVFLLVTMMPFALLVMIIQYWKAKRLARERAAEKQAG